MKTFSLFILTIVLFLISSCNKEGKKIDDSSPIIPSEEMLKDINFIFDELRTSHPNPYMRYDSLTFVRLEEKIKKECSIPKSELEFEFSLMKLNRYFEGHTFFLDFKHFAPLKNSQNLFPYVEFNDNKILLEGVPLTKIGSINTSQLASQVDSMVSWEKDTKTRTLHKNTMLNILLHRYYKESYPYTFTYKKNWWTSIKDTVTTAKVIESYRKNIIQNNYNKEFHAQPYSSEIFPDDFIAILYFNDSSVNTTDEGKKQFESYLDIFFKELKEKGIKHLFIDVSFNYGGSSHTNSLVLNHLNSEKREYTITTMGKTKGVKKSLDFYESYSPDIKKDTALYKNKFVPLLKYQKIKNRIIEEGKTDGFAGKVFVIMGNNSVSAAQSFCESIVRGKYGILVGIPTSQRTPYCGNGFVQNLPSGRYRLFMPSIYAWYDKEVQNENGFLIPDIPYSLNRPLNLVDFKKIIELS